jgi:alcohol dehydrogenase class IV
MMTEHFDFNIPTAVIFGNGRISELAKHLPAGIDRLLIVTDKKVARAGSALDKIIAQTAHLEVTMFDEVQENPSIELIRQASRVAREKDSQLVIGLGGGSPMDAAKGIALLAANDGDMGAYLAGKTPENPALPVVCIPTSSGTGSEVTQYAVFTDPQNQNKAGYSHPSIFPRFSIIDPELTYSMPEQVVIDTGFDVLTHCVEAYLSRLAFPLNDMIALHAIEEVLQHLKSAAHKNKDAMGHMSYAAMLGGIVIAHASTILLHIMAYPLTVFHRVPHGRANAALLPGFLEYMKEHASAQAREKITRLEEHFRRYGIDNIESYVNSFGIFTRLSAYGVEPSQLELFTRKTIVKGDIRITPAPITEKSLLELYRSLM